MSLVVCPTVIRCTPPNAEPFELETNAYRLGKDGSAISIELVFFNLDFHRKLFPFFEEWTPLQLSLTVDNSASILPQSFFYVSSMYLEADGLSHVTFVEELGDCKFCGKSVPMPRL